MHCTLFKCDDFFTMLVLEDSMFFGSSLDFVLKSIESQPKTKEVVCFTNEQDASRNAQNNEVFFKIILSL